MHVRIYAGGSYARSEKKKSLFVGGGPATRPLGISTFSPERSTQQYTQSKARRG